MTEELHPAISRFRRRMIDDMTIRGFTPDTQRGYVGAVRDFAAFLSRSPIFSMDAFGRVSVRP